MTTTVPPALIRPPHTRYPSTVKPAPPDPKGSGLRVLVSAASNKKIGGLVEKGRWKGCPIFALTLEERATCPTSCLNWGRCYGDNMPFAVRYQAGTALEAAVRHDVEALALKRATKAGFVVRLHVLGDFYSVAYVAHWARLLADVPPLRVYGYTHHPAGSPIGDAVAALPELFPDRAAFRRSDGVVGDPAETLPLAQTVEDQSPAAPGTVICPVQTNRTASCSTCGLCFGRGVGITFWDHGSAALIAKRRRTLPTLGDAVVVA